MAFFDQKAYEAECRHDYRVVKNCCVRVLRGTEWQLVGQYPTKQAAQLIADDYRSHGEKARVTRD